MNVEIYDIETYKKMFCYVGKNISTGIQVVFEISDRINQLFEMVSHLRSGVVEYFVGYNSLSFDSQVIQFIIDNHQKWVDYEAQQVVDKIFIFATRRIDDANYDLFPPYMEHTLWAKQIDLFKIHHFDNAAKRVSLKWLEFSLDLENIEEMPVKFDKIDLTNDEIDLTIHYCKNDVHATEKFYHLTIGDTDNELYKGKNKIQDRLDLIAEFKFPDVCINWSDVKIGDEINLQGYCEKTKKDKKAVYELKRKRRPTGILTYGKCIPPYVEFVTPEFKEFHKRLAKEKLRFNMDDSKQFSLFTYNGTTYNIAKGGIHSNEKKRKIIPREDEILKDADVGSQYPNAIFKRGLFPVHLGRAWNENFGNNIKRRLEYKKKGKTDKRFKGLGEMMKLALNGGGFGKTNEKNSWQYGPEVQFACTIGNQFEILMLIEQMEINGIHVVSANTDGIVCLYKRDKEEKYAEVCKWWEEKVGNTEMGQLEYVEYEKMIQTSVNSYIAIKKDEPDPKERIKKKGTTFLTDHEVNKNKSRRIVPIALEKYYVDDIPVEETIRKHTNIFDFCIGVKSSREYHYKTISKNNKPLEDNNRRISYLKESPLDHDKDLALQNFEREEEIKELIKNNDEIIKNYDVNKSKFYNSVVRYYPSVSGDILYKVKRMGSDAPGAEISQAEASDDTQIYITVANSIDVKRNINSYNINYQYFIDKCNKIIAGIDNPRAKKTQIVDKNQLSLF